MCPEQRSEVTVSFARARLRKLTCCSQRQFHRVGISSRLPFPQLSKESTDSKRKRRQFMSCTGRVIVAAALLLVLGSAISRPASGEDKKPNVLVIMGDDVGWFNIGAYHQGMMSGKTPNLDKLAAQGMRFTDYYAEASCTAGRANFITGEIPLRTGLTTVGQAGADVG